MKSRVIFVMVTLVVCALPGLLAAQNVELEYSTYLGGNQNDQANDMAVGSDGSVYVTGRTASDNFPIENPYQSSYSGGSWDAFVSKLSSTGTSLVYSTYLGGSGDD